MRLNPVVKDVFRGIWFSRKNRIQIIKDLALYFKNDLMILFQALNRFERICVPDKI